jgi:uncharacterized Ntn-hydrolase superfamily protein
LAEGSFPSTIVHLMRDQLVATYSIVARDPGTGELGVAVQSCYFGVGAAVPWGEAGVGVVATQSFANLDFGPEGLAMMRDGITPEDALRRLLEADPRNETRQVALLDSSGRVATHTGAACISAAGHLAGDGVSAQANMMVDDTVWPAMVAAYQSARGDLAARLVGALEAAEVNGGDIRGRQSAALLIVSGARAQKPWHGRMFDLRVDDHPDPVAEISRLLRLKRAQLAQRRFQEAAAAGKNEEAVAALRQALELAPEVDETQLSAAYLYSLQGRHHEARTLLQQVFDRKPLLAEWMDRMITATIIPSHPLLLEMIRNTRTDSSKW